MKLIKTKIGLVEYDNYFLDVEQTSFITSSDLVWHRDGNYFYLDKDDERVERKLDKDSSFVLIVGKDKIKEEDEFSSENFISYVIDEEENYYGCIDTYTKQSIYHKLVLNDGFVTCYSSDDLITWENLGSSPITNRIIRQGFKKFNNDKSMRMFYYKMYSSPLIKINNVPENYTIKLLNSDETEISHNKVDNTLTTTFMIDHIFNGYIEIFNEDDNLYLKSDLLEISYGNEYELTEFDFSFIYNGKILPYDENTVLNDIYSVYEVGIKNNSDTESFKKLNLSIENPNTDIIEVSFDNSTYTSDLVFDINKSETINFYVRINKGSNNPDFNLKNFIINIKK